MGERQDKKPLTFLITSEVLVLRGRVSKIKKLLDIGVFVFTRG